MENSEPIPPKEVLKTIALFRLVIARGTFKSADRREANLRFLQSLALLAGANGLIVGNYLTTPGRSADDDLTITRDLGFGIQ